MRSLVMDDLMNNETLGTASSSKTSLFKLPVKDLWAPHSTRPFPFASSDVKAIVYLQDF
jgi:hypothetical protein